MGGVFRNNEAMHRFELDAEGGMVVAEYRREGDTLVIEHVRTPPALQGKGLAGRLMEGVNAFSKANGVQLMAECSYARHWLDKYGKYSKLT